MQTWQSMRNTKIVEGMEAEDRSFYVSNLEEIKKMAIENGKMFDYYVEELLNYMNRE